MNAATPKAQLLTNSLTSLSYKQKIYINLYTYIYSKEKVIYILYIFYVTQQRPKKKSNKLFYHFVNCE